MIAFSRAQFNGYSETRSSAELTALLGVEPSEQHERGDLMAPDDPPFGSFDLAIWNLYPPKSDLDADPTGVAVLRWVLERLAGKGDILRTLQPDYEFDLSWWGQSADWRTDVSLPSDLLQQIAALGVDLTIVFVPANEQSENAID